MCGGGWRDVLGRANKCFLPGLRFRTAERRGMYKAAVAVAYRILVITWHILAESGVKFFTNAARLLCPAPSGTHRLTTDPGGASHWLYGYAHLPDRRLQPKPAPPNNTFASIGCLPLAPNANCPLHLPHQTPTAQAKLDSPMNTKTKKSSFRRKNRKLTGWL